MQRHSLDKDKIKILLLEGVHQNAIDVFHKNGYNNIDYHKKALEGEELRQALSEAHFVGIRSRTQLTAEVLAHAKKLVAIGCFCIGTNQVSLDSAREAGIPVFNAPFSNTRSVAELVLAEIIMLARKVPTLNASTHRGGWLKSAEGSYEVRGKTLGIIGYGHIGTQIGILAEALGLNVYYYDIEDKLPLGNAKPIARLQDLLECSDFVTLHVPQDPSTKNLMSAERIDQMKHGAHLINASRGNVVDLDALAIAIEEGRIKGAAIDVFPVEPKANGEEFQSPLRKFDQVILTPHVGGSTQEAQANIGIEVANKLVKYSDTGSTLSAVNFPEVSLSESVDPQTHRYIHIHKNQPGVLSAINQVFVKEGINIQGQYLQTDAKIGYVVFDVIDANVQQSLKELRAIPGTIRTRVIF
ncbi:phosphoglycerate dehydrogenase [Brackiella oedipodis]|uniref:phosphoglycerate dehydrogenase n=1 Tax=Brackiella oedipodis TaxID=124225 RepID=UPI000491CDEC|nr:phosphoglycerate dehydrogenase [Brackiella oedipodis]